MSSTSWWSASGKAPSCSIARPTSANGSGAKESWMNEPATVRLAHVDGRPPRQAALYWMALGTFAIGTEGFMIAAILPNIAADLVVSVALASFIASFLAAATPLRGPQVGYALFLWGASAGVGLIIGGNAADKLGVRAVIRPSLFVLAVLLAGLSAVAALLAAAL